MSRSKSVAPSVIYVDPDRNAWSYLQKYLAADLRRYDMTFAESATDAIELIASRRFDLYIFEYCLPEMTGAELCSHVRRHDRRTPVMIYSALAREVDRDNAMNAGANAYIVKREETDVLAASMRRLLRPVGRQAALSRSIRRSVSIL